MVIVYKSGHKQCITVRLFSISRLSFVVDGVLDNSHSADSSEKES